MPILVWLISLLINFYIALLVIGAVMSWFNLDPRHPVVQFMDRMTEPVLAPIRRVLGTAGGLDFSPLVAVFLLMVLRNFLGRLL